MLINIIAKLFSGNICLSLLTDGVGAFVSNINPAESNTDIFVAKDMTEK